MWNQGSRVSWNLHINGYDFKKWIKGYSSFTYAKRLK